MKRIIFCVTLLSGMLCLFGCSLMEQETKSSNEAAITLSFDETEESVGDGEADFSQGDLLALFTSVNNAEIVDYIYDDFNKDGIHEAFVLTEDEDYYKLWYVHAKECLMVCEKLENLDYPAMGLMEFNTRDYLLLQQVKDDIRNTIVYSVDNHSQVLESDISRNGFVSKNENGEVLLQLDQKRATAESFVLDTQTYYLYYVFDEGFREYGAIPISMEQFLEFKGAGEVIDSISKRYENYEVDYSFLYRANHCINVNITLSNDETTIYKNMTLSYDDTGVEELSDVLGDGRIENANMLEIATFPTAFKYPKKEINQQENGG
ncbi:MAG: hypothetical protein K2K56_00360 [Lachnospiraceae bacterium]|nr:hypothetical protein [Lachnospiraceae bacterium]